MVSASTPILPTLNCWKLPLATQGSVELRFRAFAYVGINPEPNLEITDSGGEPTGLTPTALNGIAGRRITSGRVFGMTSFIIVGSVGMVIGFNIGFFAYAILEIGKT
jgi:hypothetical protein